MAHCLSDNDILVLNFVPISSSLISIGRSSHRTSSAFKFYSFCRMVTVAHKCGGYWTFQRLGRGTSPTSDKMKYKFVAFEHSSFLLNFLMLARML